MKQLYDIGIEVTFFICDKFHYKKIYIKYD